MKKSFIVAALALAAVLSTASTASAADERPPINKILYHMTGLDAAVTEVAGVPLQVLSSDNYGEWDSMAGDYGVDGWTCITCSSSASLYNPYDGGRYSIYRTIWIHPDIRNTFKDLGTYGFRQDMDFDSVGEAMLTLDHEGMHWRLFSRDEARVNACAFADLPRFLQKNFGLQPTTQQTVDVAQSYRVKVRYRAKTHGRYVWKSRFILRTRWVPTVQTVSNPIFQGIIDGAARFRSAQPAPYNAGACY
jgi:hypothetical protein